MWSASNPPPISGNTACGRPKKYIDYYNISYSYLHLVMERAKQRFSPDDLAKLEEMLQIVSDELMPEIQLPK